MTISGSIDTQKAEENLKKGIRIEKWKYKSKKPKNAITKILMKHGKNLANCLIILLKLHPKLNRKQSTKKDLK